jgi:hypothetical protein
VLRVPDVDLHGLPVPHLLRLDDRLEPTTRRNGESGNFKDYPGNERMSKKGTSKSLVISLA